MTTAQRRAIATIPWSAAVWIVVGWNAIDAAGMLIGGDRAYRSPSYGVLRQIPGGMRVYGVALGVLVLLTVYSLGRHAASGRERFLRACLALLAGWQVGWLIAVCTTWLVDMQVYSFSAVPKLSALAAVAFVTARWTPHVGRR